MYNDNKISYMQDKSLCSIAGCEYLVVETGRYGGLCDKAHLYEKVI